MSRQIGSLNHEELIGPLVAITVQLFFLIPQKFLLAEIGGRGCPFLASLFHFIHSWLTDWFAHLRLHEANSSALKHHVPDALGLHIYMLSWCTSSKFSRLVTWKNNSKTMPPHLCTGLLNLWEELICKVIALSPLYLMMHCDHYLVHWLHDCKWGMRSRTHDPCIRWAGFCCVEQKLWTHMIINLSSVAIKEAEMSSEQISLFWS